MDDTTTTTNLGAGGNANNTNTTSTMACDALLAALPAATIGCALPPAPSLPAAPLSLAFRPLPPPPSPSGTIGLPARTKASGPSTTSGRVEKKSAVARSARVAAMLERRAADLEKFLREKGEKEGEEICVAALREMAADAESAKNAASLAQGEKWAAELRALGR